MKKIFLPFLIDIFALTSCTIQDDFTNLNKEDSPINSYTFPTENATHEGTWLNWPHHYTYGTEYRNEIEPIWIEMVTALMVGVKRYHIKMTTSYQ